MLSTGLKRGVAVPGVSEAAGSRGVAWAVAGGIFVLCVIAFWPAFTAGFVDLDDSVYTYECRHVLNGLSGEDARWAFTTFTGGLWIPMTWLSLQATVAVFGAEPFGFHLVNVLLHACNGVLLFLILRYATGSTWRAMVAAVLFAVHPLRVESVVWITERKDVLSVFFSMLTVGTYIGYARSVGRRWIWLMGVYVLAACAMMAKPSMVTLPGLLLLLDIWPLGRMGRTTLVNLVAEKVPLFAVSAVDAVLTVKAAASMDVITSLSALSFEARVGNVLTAMSHYLRLQLLPIGLSAHYPPVVATPMEVARAAALVGAIWWLVLWQRGKRPWMVVGWLWYQVALLPVSGLVQGGDVAEADRFSYLPTVGLLIAVVWSIPEEWVRDRARRLAVGAVVVVMVATLGALAWLQCGRWHDSLRLWTQAVNVAPDDVVNQLRLAGAYFEQGNAVECRRRFIVLAAANPNNSEVQRKMGDVFLMDRDFENAMRCYKRALEINHRDWLAYNDAGVLMESFGNYAEAMVLYKASLQINPNDDSVRRNLERVGRLGAGKK